MNIIDLRAAASKDAKTIVAAACFGAAMPDKTVAATCKGVDLDAAKDLKLTRLSDVFAAFGCGYRPGNDAETGRALNAAFSGSEIPSVLANIAQKFALAGFGAAGEQWREISRAVPVKDFKSVKGVRFAMGGLLQPLEKGGELKQVDLSDEARDIQAETKGAIVAITREDLVNDDLGVLATIPERFGMMAGRTINRDVFGALSSVASDYGANTTGELNLANLAAAYALAMGIKDGEGNPLSPLPDRILCSPANYVAAQSIYLSEKIVAGAGVAQGDANTLRGVLKPVASPYLSGTAYWLFNTAFPLVDIAFLGGNQEPVVESANADFAQLGIQMRCYYDYGVSAGDLKAALYSTGA